MLSETTKYITAKTTALPTQSTCLHISTGKFCTTFYKYWNPGASIPMGQGGHVPPIFGLGGT